jgi:prophage regulatory protein
MNPTSNARARQTALDSIPSARAENQRVLRLPEVCAATGLGRSFIYQLQAQHQFPNRIKIGVRAVGWLEGEVQQWLTERIALSRSES